MARSVLTVCVLRRTLRRWLFTVLELMGDIPTGYGCRSPLGFSKYPQSKKIEALNFSEHDRRSSKHVSESLKHDRRSSKHVSESLKHDRRNSKHVPESLKHVRRSSKHVSESLKHDRRNSKPIRRQGKSASNLRLKKTRQARSKAILLFTYCLQNEAH